LFSWFAYDAPTYRNKVAVGFILKPGIAELTRAPYFKSTAQILKDAGYEAAEVWEEWTVKTMDVSLLLLWLGFFVVYSYMVTAFVVWNLNNSEALAGGTLTASESAAFSAIQNAVGNERGIAWERRQAYIKILMAGNADSVICRLRWGSNRKEIEIRGSVGQMRPLTDGYNVVPAQNGWCAVKLERVSDIEKLANFFRFLFDRTAGHE
jgi:hypothetical protein